MPHHGESVRIKLKTNNSERQIVYPSQSTAFDQLVHLFTTKYASRLGSLK